MNPRRTFGLLIVGLAVSGCGYIVETAASNLGGSTSTRVVADKSPPDLLIARDGTTCTVSESRFDRIRIGQAVTCIWTSGQRF